MHAIRYFAVIDASVRVRMAAVIVPVYSGVLATLEVISLAQCCRTLRAHPVVLFAPTGLDIQPAVDIARECGVEPIIERFHRKYFASTATYNVLLLTKEFYQRFAGYRYILVHQLDAFVFSDELEKFCDLEFDYIGAPWVHDPERPGNVGNGGFSLRKISAALSVLERDSTSLSTSVFLGWRSMFRLGRFIHRHTSFDRRMRLGSFVPRALCHFFHINEDGYWGQNCDKLPSFNTAPYPVAVKFSFELDPAIAFERNGRRLPFGCHGWARFDADFWRPHITGYAHAWSSNKLGND
jgi:hypothetical protein